MKTFRRLGTDKPHASTGVKKEEVNGSHRPLSPSDSEATQTAHPSSGVKSEDLKSTELAEQEQGTRPVKAENNRTVPIIKGAESRRKGRARKSEPREVPTNKEKPYEGLFSAVVKDATAPPLIEIQDLRKKVKGGEKSWTEPIYCLICATEIH